MPAILDEWFDGTLAAWTVSGADIVTADNDEKLRLNGSGESAYRDFTAPATGPLIVESDLRYSASGVQGYLEVMDAGGGPAVRAAVRFTGGNAYVATDTEGETSHAFAAGVYRQFILAFDQDAATVRFYISGADQGGRNGTWDLIAEKGYSGGTIDRVSFRTTTSGTVYADMVQVFVPGTFIMGDSISDGKPNWSEQPNFATDAGGAHGRLGPQEDEANSPAYQLGLLTGEHVAARGFGAANSTQVLNGVGSGEGVQGLFLDQYGREIVLYVGHNDLYAADNLATLKANVASILTTLLGGGINAGDVTFCKIAPSDLFEGTPSNDEDNRIEYNRWLADFCAQHGCRIAFASEALNDDTKTSVYKRLNPSYDVGDGTHLNTAGDVVLAREMYRARVPGGVLRRAGGGLVPASFLTNEDAAAVVTGAAYAVRRGHREVAGLAVRVRTNPPGMTKGASYRVAVSTFAGAPGLQYVVRSTPAITRSATYALPTGGGGAPVQMQRGCSYVVAVTNNTYYVDQSIGDDGNPGTEAEPFLTIQAGANAATSPGDEVQVKQGVYVEDAESIDIASGGRRGVVTKGDGSYAANQVKYNVFRPYPGHEGLVEIDQTTASGTGETCGFAVTTDYTIIRGFLIHEIETAGVVFGGSLKSIVEDCEIYHVYGPDNDAGVKVNDGAVDTIIRRNRIRDNSWTGPNEPPNGIQIWDSENTTVCFNDISEHRTGVFWKRAPSSLVYMGEVYGNIFHDVSHGIEINYSGPTNPDYGGFDFHHNIFYVDAYSSMLGIDTQQLDGPGGAPYVNGTGRIYSNTFDITGGSARSLIIAGVADLQIWDNLFCGAPGYDIRTYDHPADITYCDFNGYTSGFQNQLAGITGSEVTYGTLTAWRAASLLAGWLSYSNPDGDGFTSTEGALFTDADARDYTLIPGSPAIGVGRFGGDIGALPFTGTPPKTTVQAQAKYTVTTLAAALTVDAEYRVSVTPAAATLALGYEVVPPPGWTARALRYAVRATAPGAALGTGYGVRTTVAAVGSALAYAIDPTVSVDVPRGLVYRVTAVAVVARGLTYLVGYKAEDAHRIVVLPPEAHGVSVPPEIHTVEVIE